MSACPPDASSGLPWPQSNAAPRTHTLTRNLFHGQGESEHALSLLAGSWPTDMSGHAFIVGPDKRAPGDHWFFGHGLLCRIDCQPDADGKIRVRHALVNTPMKRLRDRYPKRFRPLFGLLEASPFGITNFANTNVLGFEGRLFLGYDAGRPLEIDPVTLSYLTPVGAVDEWAQILPAPVEPFLTIAAHPATDWDERALYFVNYVRLTPNGRSETYLARWDLEGKVVKWRLEGMSPFDSIHDVKATRDYLVITDLPFVQDVAAKPEAKPRRRVQDHTLLWLVKKADLARTAPGQSVPVVELKIPHPTGHLTVDYAPGSAGELTVYLQHAEGTDLTLALQPNDRSHGQNDAIASDFFGLPAFAPQPVMVGRYRIDPARGVLLESRICADPGGVWGPLLATSNQYTREAQQRPRHLFYGGLGFDPTLLSERYASLYGDRAHLTIPIADLPGAPRSGGVQRFDLADMRVADAYLYAGGAFPHPPTFIPRDNCQHELDGYLLAPIHQQGSKEIHVFDAARLAQGPIARAGLCPQEIASGAQFCPPLLLHSCWMPRRMGPRPSQYKVSPLRDALGALRSAPSELLRTLRILKADQS